MVLTGFEVADDEFAAFAIEVVGATSFTQPRSSKKRRTLPAFWVMVLLARVSTAPSFFLTCPAAVSWGLPIMASILAIISFTVKGCRDPSLPAVEGRAS